MEVFKSNVSFCNIYPNFPKTFFIHEMSKNKADTWKEYLVDTQNGNLKLKSTIKLTQNFLQFLNGQG